VPALPLLIAILIFLHSAAMSASGHHAAIAFSDQKKIEFLFRISYIAIKWITLRKLMDLDAPEP
jgi:hypothetical protein